MKFAREEELPTGFVGISPTIVKIREQIERLAVARTPILILGESGTGKEVAARALYNAQPRGNFVPIDCGSLVGSLMESELFGHTRGAFTGAGDAKRGLIDLANGGTAFFDEIGDLPLELQVKLLRVLQEREFRPLGSVTRIKVDLRIIAATHRNLDQEVRKGRFREDLFHRLNVIRMTLPPLRDRREDIPLLIERFIETCEQRYVLTPEAIEELVRYDWPGNIRELKNCLDRMMALSSGPLLHIRDMPTTIQHRMRSSVSREMAATVGNTGWRTATESASTATSMLDATATTDRNCTVIPLSELERRAILNALEQTKGDRTIAASLLGVGRTTLYRKLKEYAVPN